MDIKTTQHGVIIGRFQTPELHSEHTKLIQYVLDRHEKVLLFLGVSPTLGNKKHPMDFITRKYMIEEQFGFSKLTIMPLSDNKSNEIWSKQLDSKIKEVFPLGSVTIYGSRDSFIPYYSGINKTLELEPEVFISATDVRELASKKVIGSSEFRAGIIYSVYNQFPVVYSTVDVAIIKNDEILLGQKLGETEWRFIGGFVDPTDESDEIAAKRETLEETGLEVADFEYICSMQIEDWRYRGIKDRSIMTRFFKAKYIFGCPTPQDDINALKWFKLTPELENILVEEHKKLFKKLIKCQ
jgi:bifunctional NMN adenylyltransferase/nudix hydrolase